MLTSFYLQKKRSEVCIKARSFPGNLTQNFKMVDSLALPTCFPHSSKLGEKTVEYHLKSFWVMMSQIPMTSLSSDGAD